MKSIISLIVSFLAFAYGLVVLYGLVKDFMYSSGITSLAKLGIFAMIVVVILVLIYLLKYIKKIRNVE